MSKVLDEFYTDLYCVHCKEVTEHNIQKIDEDNNGEFIGYYSKCNICGVVDEVDNEMGIRE